MSVPAADCLLALSLHYMLQCYHYMAVTGKRTWYIAAVILGKEFVYHRLEFLRASHSSRSIFSVDIFWYIIPSVSFSSLLLFMKARYFDAPDLQDLGKNAYRFINAVSDFATHADPIRRTKNYRENLFASVNLCTT